MKTAIRSALVFLLLCCFAPVSSAMADFGVVPGSFGVPITNADGTTVTQAGSHPYAITTRFLFNTHPNALTGAIVPDGDVKNIDVALPPGFVGDPGATPRCTFDDFSRTPSYVGFNATDCPDISQIGLASVGLGRGQFGNGFAEPGIFNLVPPPGVPAEFGFSVLGLKVLLTPSVRPGDYGLTIHSKNISQAKEVYGTTVIFWGVPGDPSHDPHRYCTGTGNPGCSVTPPYKAFLRTPTSCAGPLNSTITYSSWQEPIAAPLTDSYTSQDSFAHPLGLDGCNKLPFNPSFTAAPDTSQADTPAGLTFDLKVPQDGLLEPNALATADIKNTTITLPAGVVINPGQAAGLQACQSNEDGVGVEGPPSCPSASKVGTDVISTPLLEDKLEGDVYVLQSDPPNLKLLVSAEAPEDGLYIKLIGDVHLDPVTGQLTTTFTETPQLPFTDFKLSFSGGAQAALATPPFCGTYTTTSDFTPWSTPGDSDVFPTSSFAVDSGPDGTPCASSLPFTPVLHAGATTDQAGGYTNFSLLLQRGDGQQRISSLQFKTPEGLLGMISKVGLCPEPQISQGDCPSGSQIGHTIVTAGPGPYPLVVPEPGQPPAPIYLTGPYKGAPYGLSIVVPIIAGPFNLGTVVVRASIAVDPNTSQLTITTDPLPSILDGIPTDLRTINAVIDRAGFMFNPTNCSPMAFSGTAFSTEGASAGISSHFQVGSCQSLKFKPNFQVSTSGRTSRASGASLDAKILYPTGAVGANQASSQSNIASVKVDLPKQLPSRLTTLQKACPDTVFNVNPAVCPKASLIGHATAITPVLAAALGGPVYFVSHGGAAFPDLIVVLEGQGIRVDLTGSTFISKVGITSSTFKTVPDVPITSFDLVLPEGPFSALASNGNLCKSKLAMPTAFTAQDGAVIHQSTKITVTGCPKAKKSKKAKQGSTSKKHKAQAQKQGKKAASAAAGARKAGK
jgi:hypothetical protein